MELDKLYEFLKSNYVEDDDHMFRFDYSKDFLKWHLNPPGFFPEWLISVVLEDKIKNKKKMVGFIAGLPIKIHIHGTDITLAEIDFLCVKKEFRSKRLAPVLIKEVSRRIHMRNMWWAVYTSGTLLPKPFCQTTYYHRNLDVKKLVDIQFTCLPHNMNMTRAKKHYNLPDELPIPGFRSMEEKDADDVFVLLDKLEKKYKVHGYYSKEEVAHWFLPRKNVIYSYVKTNEQNNNENKSTKISKSKKKRMIKKEKFMSIKKMEYLNKQKIINSLEQQNKNTSKQASELISIKNCLCQVSEMKTITPPLV